MRSLTVQKIISEPDELLVELINETLEKICGHKAEDKQIIDFINNKFNPSVPIVKKPLNGVQLNEQKETVQKTVEPLRKNKELPEDGMECRFTYKNKPDIGIIKDGMLWIGTQNSKSFSGAAGFLAGGTSLNGWILWEIKLPDTNHWLLADNWCKETNF